MFKGIYRLIDPIIRWQVCTSRREAVKKYTPETECKKVPRQLCGPSGCVPEAGPEECFDRKATIVQEVR